MYFALMFDFINLINFGFNNEWTIRSIIYLLKRNLSVRLFIISFLIRNFHYTYVNIVSFFFSLFHLF